MSNDPELQAMDTVYKALDGLDEEARSRVIRWTSDRFAISVANGPGRNGGGVREAEDEAAKTVAHFQSVAEVFPAARPKTTADKVLVIAAYLQHAKGGNDIRGHEINEELKHLGHGVTNITRALESLMKAKPQLVIQTRKDGKSRQAQKKYKVTAEGVTRVNRMLSGLDGHEE